MVFTNALEYDPFQIPKNQWSTHSVTDTDGGGFNFLHHAKLGGRLSKGKLGYPCHILPYAAIIHHPYIGRWMAGGICWYIISLTLPRLPNFSNFETSFFLLHDLFSKLKPPKNWKHEMNIFGILFYRLENNMKSWKSSFSKLIFPSTNLPRKKKTAKQLVALTKKWVVFLCFSKGMKVADIFSWDRSRLKCHIGKLMMPSGDTMGQCGDSKVVGMRTFDS